MAGYVHVYTGDGKGKTTAAMGLALRAAGAGLSVFIVQFVKGMWYAELAALGKVGDQITVLQAGRACFITREPADEDVRAAREGLEAVIDRHRRWHEFDQVVVCHGDVHPGNVLMTTDGPVLLDWDLLCLAPPGWDHGPMLLFADRWGGRPGEYDEFARGYGRSLADDPTTIALAELRLVAATLMRVVASIGDPRARPEAERRLRYWRGDPDAPSWTPQ